MYILTLVYPDGSQFIVGGFPDQASIDAWVSAEEAKPTWIQGTTTKVDEPPPPVTGTPGK